MDALSNPEIELAKRLAVSDAALAHANAVIAVRLHRKQSDARLAELQANARAAWKVLDASINQLVASEAQ